jgi:hypothetical protein
MWKHQDIYHTSEDSLKEMMGKYHKAIEVSFSKKVVRVSECKIEALDKIDTRKTFSDGSGCKCLFDVIVQPANLLERMYS